MKPEEIRRFRNNMRQLQRSLGWQAKSDAACCGVTVAQCHALLEIGCNSGITLIDLASALTLDTSTISRTIEGMVRDGLVKRKAQPDDRRYLSLTLTQKGQKTYNNINCTYDLYYKDIFADIPEEKHIEILENIQLLANALLENNNRCCREELNK